MNPSDLIAIAPQADGVVRIGAPPLEATYLSQVDLPGMTVQMDPFDAAPAAHALVYDAGLAAESVGLLFGDETAEAVTRGATVSVPAVASPELADIERLGWLEWYDRYRPVPVDGALLRVEATVLRTRLPDDEPAIEEPEQMATLLQIARRIRKDPDLPLARELRDLIREAFTVLPAVDPDVPELLRERELLQIEDAWGETPPGSPDMDWLARQLAPVAAGHLGGGRALEGTTALDWERVPRALLPALEDSVRFVVVDDHVDVTVPAPARTVHHPAVPEETQPAPNLVASLRSSAWPLPLAEGGLSFQGQRGVWGGRLRIVPGAVALVRKAPVLDVDVRSSALPWVAPNQRRTREAAARRWVARGVVARRLAAGSGDERLDGAGAGALRYAARLWEASGDHARAERCLALVTSHVEPSLSLAERWLLMGGGLDR